MENDDYFYVTLNTLSQIEAYDKLAIKNNNGTNILFVDKYSYLSSFTRYYYGYSRQNIIDYLKEFLGKFDKYCEHFLVHTSLCNNDITRYIHLGLHYHGNFGN